MLVLTEDQRVGHVISIENGIVFAFFTLSRKDGSTYYGEAVYLEDEVTLIPCEES